MNRRTFLKLISAAAIGLPLSKLNLPTKSRAQLQLEAMESAMIVRRLKRAGTRYKHELADAAMIDEHQEWQKGLTPEQIGDFRFFLKKWNDGLGSNGRLA